MDTYTVFVLYAKQTGESSLSDLRWEPLVEASSKEAAIRMCNKIPAKAQVLNTATQEIVFDNGKGDPRIIRT